jgi:hypothetical protein
MFAGDLCAKYWQQIGNPTKADQRTKLEEEDYMVHNIVKVSLWSVVALFISLCPIALHAQGTMAPETPAAKPMSSKVTVTGCLQKGDSADEFAIAGKDGKTWELSSKTVKLDEHVGHTVTVTGVRHHETKAEAAKEEKTEAKESKEAEAMEAGDLNVTSLKMVSESCTK